ncbi:mitochondrial import translocase, subunit Tom22 [Meredithblackwellia eburnea MCA 4105]
MVKIETVADDWESSSSADSAIAEDPSDDELDNDLELEEDDFDPSKETLADRLYALRDIVPPSTRKSLRESWHTSKAWATWSANTVGRVAWIVTTSALLVGLPAMLSIEGEAGIVAQEKEYYASQQQQQPGALPAFGQPAPAATGVVPTGF